MPLDPGTFGGTPACHRLVEVFNVIGDAKMAGRFCKLFQVYQMGIDDILSIQSRGTRHLVLKLWYQEYRRVFDETFGSFFVHNGAPISLIHNVVGTTWKQGIRNGDVMERLRQ